MPHSHSGGDQERTHIVPVSSNVNETNSTNSSVDQYQGLPSASTHPRASSVSNTTLSGFSQVHHRGGASTNQFSLPAPLTGEMHQTGGATLFTRVRYRKTGGASLPQGEKGPTVSVSSSPDTAVADCLSPDPVHSPNESIPARNPSFFGEPPRGQSFVDLPSRLRESGCLLSHAHHRSIDVGLAMGTFHKAPDWCQHGTRTDPSSK